MALADRFAYPGSGREPIARGLDRMMKKTASKTTRKPAARATRSSGASKPRPGPSPATDPEKVAASPPRADSVSKQAALGPRTRPGVRAAGVADKSTAAQVSPGRQVDGRSAEGAAEKNEKSEKSSDAIELAEGIVAAGDAAAVIAHAGQLMSDKPTMVTASARVIDELLARKPEMLVPVIDKLVTVITSGSKRAVQTAAAALPTMARLAPARVARHLPVLTERFAEASDVAKDGLVSTFAALCTASVAYQKRLEPVLEVALSTAEPKTLLRWTEIVLPSLKGEPHARARAIVEQRLHQIPRPLAQPIANFLGVKLRLAAPPK